MLAIRRDRFAALSWWRQGLLAAAFGAIGALALPPLHLLPALLISIPGLLLLLDVQPSLRRAGWVGFAWGWGHALAGIYWVTHAILFDLANFWWLVPLAAPGLALPLAGFAVPPALVAWALPAGWPRLFGFAGAWVLAELLRVFLFTGFPWNPLGSVWAFAALPVQAAAVIGVHGLSLLTVLLAGLPAAARGGRPYVAAAAGLALLAGFGAWRLAAPEALVPGLRLVLIQGNIAQEVKWRPEQREANFRTYLTLTREALAAEAAAHPGSRLVAIWPETASPYLLAQDAEARELAAETLPPGALLLAGTVRAEWDTTNRLRAVWNSLVTMDDDGVIGGVYDKAHLVPFGEYMPLSGLLPIRLAAGGMDFSAGPGPVAVTLPGLPPFGALVCYEVIFPGAVAPAERPDWLVNITNDGWFGHSAGPWQHLSAARLRAVEEGLPLARAAQTGISAMFDGAGRRLGLLPLGVAGSLAMPLPTPRAPTLFSYLGLWAPAGLALACLLLGWRMRGRVVAAAGLSPPPRV
jgi:apolipoprotein N-acyltransferase